MCSITLEVVFNNHNPLRFLCLIEFENLALCKLGEIESIVVRLMTFFTKHICQCSLKRATKSPKDLFVKPWGPSWKNSHIFYNTLASDSINDICKIHFFIAWLKNISHFQTLDHLNHMIHMFIYRMAKVLLIIHKRI